MADNSQWEQLLLYLFPVLSIKRINLRTSRPKYRLFYGNTDRFYQAQTQLNSTSTTIEAEIVLFSVITATHPPTHPTTHPTGKVVKWNYILNTSTEDFNYFNRRLRILQLKTSNTSTEDLNWRLQILVRVFWYLYQTTWIK